MTVYKAFRNFYIFLLALVIAIGAGMAGIVAYELFYKESEQVVYAVSKYGSTGEEVRKIQKVLKDLGYYNGDLDGIFGQKTQKAVKTFQRDVGLTSDGIVGKATLLYLGLSDSGSGSTSTTYSDADVQLLAKVISAEARGESYEGQVAVGAVILNRVAHSSFPDSISGVVYQSGAFSCVYDSNWYAPVSETSKKAAIDALNGWDPTGGAIYYFNPDKTNDAFMHSRPVIAVIGSHKFCM